MNIISCADLGGFSGFTADHLFMPIFESTQRQFSLTSSSVSGYGSLGLTGWYGDVEAQILKENLDNKSTLTSAFKDVLGGGFVPYLKSLVRLHRGTLTRDTLIGAAVPLAVDGLTNPRGGRVRVAIDDSLGEAINIGTLTGSRSFQNSVGNSDTNDYYRFDVTQDSLALSTAVTPLTSGFNSTYGYGLINAAAAVASAIGQNSSLPDVANLGGNNWGNDLVMAPEAWARGYTGQGIVVAVVDTGVDYNHPDLAGNIWVNSLETAGNGVDDDGNGYLDDVRGWDFVNNDNNPLDRNGHGTHVASTIAAVNNDIGTTGVAYNARIMPVQVLSDRGRGSNIGVANGIRYAANNGAQVINLSLGGGYSAEIYSAIQYATNERGAIVVMAAGNDGASQPSYPAFHATEYGLAIGAVDSASRIASFSNRPGTNTAMRYVVAPGVSIYSAIPNNSYATYNGTSMATPHVAGVVALMLSANSNLTPTQVRDIVTGTATSLA